MGSIRSERYWGREPAPVVGWPPASPFEEQVMVVYVLLETAESQPLAVLQSCDPADWPELLPRDARAVLAPTPGPHTNRKVVGAWDSNMLGCTLQLVAYVVL